MPNGVESPSLTGTQEAPSAPLHPAPLLLEERGLARGETNAAPTRTSPKPPGFWTGLGPALAPALAMPSMLVATVFLHGPRGGSSAIWVTVGVATCLCSVAVQVREDQRVAGLLSGAPAALGAAAQLALFSAALAPFVPPGSAFPLVITLVFAAQMIAALWLGGGAPAPIALTTSMAGPGYRDAALPEIDRRAYLRSVLLDGGVKTTLAVLGGASVALAEARLGGAQPNATIALAVLTVISAWHFPWKPYGRMDLLRGGRAMWLVAWSGYLMFAIVVLDARAAAFCLPALVLAMLWGRRQQLTEAARDSSSQVLASMRKRDDADQKANEAQAEGGAVSGR